MTPWALILIFMFKEIEMKIRNEYLWLALVVIVIIVGPLLSIWSLNTLFPVLAIPYTFETWLAVMLVGGMFRGNFSSKKD
jgi:hypothetical protein